jgi:hypothetical protein
VCRCPGFAASSEILLPRRMETPNPNPEAQASGEHRCIALLRVRLRDDLSPWRKTAVRNVRDNNAARVAGPGRICFPPLIPKIVPRVPHPSAHFAEGWDSTVPSLLGFSWYAPDFEDLQENVPFVPCLSRDRSTTKNASAARILLKTVNDCNGSRTRARRVRRIW